MTEQEKNIELVKNIFPAISKGDVDTVLSVLADNVDWQSPATNAIGEPISWAKPRKSRDEVKAFFKELYEKVKILEMKPISFAAHDDRVFVEGTLRGIVNSTGREYSFDWLMVLTLKNGKCVRMRNYYDTAATSRAFLMELRKAA